jgi:hypothetical protein
MSTPRKFDHEAIVRYLLDNPTCTSQEAAEHFGCRRLTIKLVAAKAGIKKLWARNG